MNSTRQPMQRQRHREWNGRWDSFAAANASRNEAKLTYSNSTPKCLARLVALSRFSTVTFNGLRSCEIPRTSLHCRARLRDTTVQRQDSRQRLPLLLGWGGAVALPCL